MKASRRKAVLVLILRCGGVLLGLTAVIYHLLINTVLENGFMVKHNLAYFTLQTNIFSTVIFAVLAVRSALALYRHQDEIPQFHHSLHLACTLFITITLLGYWLLLAPLTGVPKAPLLLWDTLLLHTLMPLYTLLDYILFAPHGGLPYTDAFRWLTYPVLYVTSVTVLSRLIDEPYYSFQMGEKTVDLLFPYPFLDPQVTGCSGLVLVILALAAVFLLLSFLFLFLDRLLSRKK